MGNHYVPKFYLKGFTDKSQNNHIWVFQENKLPFQTSVQNVAQENNFYSNEIEQVLANDVEEPAKEIINNVKNQKTISLEERTVLAKYLMALWKRVPKTKEFLQPKMSEIFNSILEQTEEKISKVELEQPDKKTILDRRRQEIGKIRTNQKTMINKMWMDNLHPDKTPEPIEIFQKMTWRFLIAPEGQFYITSDNPFFFFQGLGIGRENSEVSIPITKEIALLATWQTDMKEGYFRARPQAVKEFNRRTIQNSNQYIYCPYRAEWIIKMMKKPKHEIRLNRIVG
jgi:hypothetical protein